MTASLPLTNGGTSLYAVIDKDVYVLSGWWLLPDAFLVHDVLILTSGCSAGGKIKVAVKKPPCLSPSTLHQSQHPGCQGMAIGGHTEIWKVGICEQGHSICCLN